MLLLLLLCPNLSAFLLLELRRATLKQKPWTYWRPLQMLGVFGRVGSCKHRRNVAAAHIHSVLNNVHVFISSQSCIFGPAGDLQ